MTAGILTLTGSDTDDILDISPATYLTSLGDDDEDDDEDTQGPPDEEFQAMRFRRSVIGRNARPSHRSAVSWVLAAWSVFLFVILLLFLVRWST
jgi:hypothetical protein